MLLCTTPSELSFGEGGKVYKHYCTWFRVRYLPPSLSTMWESYYYDVRMIIDEGALFSVVWCGGVVSEFSSRREP